jgi:hypothetical protein
MIVDRVKPGIEEFIASRTRRWRFFPVSGTYAESISFDLYKSVYTDNGVQLLSIEVASSCIFSMIALEWDEIEYLLEMLESMSKTCSFPIPIGSISVENEYEFFDRVLGTDIVKQLARKGFTPYDNLCHTKYTKMLGRSE